MGAFLRVVGGFFAGLFEFTFSGGFEGLIFTLPITLFLLAAGGVVLIAGTLICLSVLAVTSVVGLFIEFDDESPNNASDNSERIRITSDNPASYSERPRARVVPSDNPAQDKRLHAKAVSNHTPSKRSRAKASSNTHISNNSAPDNVTPNSEAPKNNSTIWDTWSILGGVTLGGGIGAGIGFAVGLVLLPATFGISLVPTAFIGLVVGAGVGGAISGGLLGAGLEFIMRLRSKPSTATRGEEVVTTRPTNNSDMHSTLGVNHAQPTNPTPASSTSTSSTSVGQGPRQETKRRFSLPQNFWPKSRGDNEGRPRDPGSQSGEDNSPTFFLGTRKAS